VGLAISSSGTADAYGSPEVRHPLDGAATGAATTHGAPGAVRGVQGAADGAAAFIGSMAFRVTLVGGAASVSAIGADLAPLRGLVVYVVGAASTRARLLAALPVIAGARPIAVVLWTAEQVQHLDAQSARLVLDAHGVGDSLQARDRPMALRAL
jgi:hypothetical protein